MAEYAEYASEPQRPLQLWLRRPPPERALDGPGRAAAADRYMEPGAAHIRQRHVMLGDTPIGALAVGSLTVPPRCQSHH